MKILDKEVLVDDHGTRVVRIVLDAPHIAQKAQPGQFVVLMVSEEGERVPLTVVRAEKNQVTLIYQEAGFSTKLLGMLDKGDELYACAGPLGHATQIKNYGKVVLVAGGVGIAEIFPVAKAFKDAGNHVDVIIGARNRDLLFLDEPLRTIADELHVATDDGSYGTKGFTTDILQDLLQEETYDLVYAVGPIPMMRKVAAVTEPFEIKTLVSLNTLMLDGTGMCGCCRVTVKGAVKFACVDGPEFDAQGVDWDELSKRNAIYEDKERHVCKLHNV